ncbi:MAG: glycosyltransferase [Gammaproteobacteria bacterium]|nr:glycosyltransferase [Gammaproteobacteria bacterium]
MSSRHLVMVISSLRSGGAERVASTVANAFAQKMRVTIVCLSNKEDAFYSLSGDVSVMYLDLLSPQSSVMGAVKANVYRIRTMRKTIKDLEPDLIVSFMLETNVLMFLSQLAVKTPLVVCEHTDPELVQHKLPWRVLRNLTYRLCDRVVVLNEYMKSWFEKSGSRRVCVIPNPIQVGVNDNVDLQTPKPYILGMGRLIASKSFDRLIEAYAMTRQTFPDWHLVIAGDGGLKEVLQQQIVARDLEGYVHLIGNTSQPQRWMKQAEIFASTSKIEAFPMAICEAMMSGLPVVAVAYNPGVETLIPATAGFVVPQDEKPNLGCEQLFVTALEELMGDVEKRKRMGKQAAQSVEKYAVANVIKQWEVLFDELETNTSLLHSTSSRKS